MELSEKVQKEIAGHCARWITQHLIANKYNPAMAVNAGISAGNRAASDTALTIREYNDAALRDIATTTDKPHLTNQSI